MRLNFLTIVPLLFITSEGSAQSSVTDIDGNSYQTVDIGSQTWIKENLKVTHYLNGDVIPTITDDAQWINLTSGATCNYHNVASDYGKLYNFFAVSDPRGLCPDGWHVPSDLDWTTLIVYCGGEGTAGSVLKESGTTHWSAPNAGTTNESGFTALPGGWRWYVSGSFSGQGDAGTWWSSTASNNDESYTREMYYDDNSVPSNTDKKIGGNSVRCVKANINGINNVKDALNLSVYPIPSTDDLYIHCNSTQLINIEIYNLMGVCVLQKVIDSTIRHIDISSLPSGSYLLRVKSVEAHAQTMIIKE